MSDTVDRGLDEITLRNKFGDAGYETWKAKSDALDDLKLLAENAHVDSAKATAKLTAAKATFWSMAGLAVFCGTVCGVAEFLRWVMR